MCDSCLVLFCYDAKGKPKDNFSLYPFYDEGTMQVEKLRQARRTSSLWREEGHSGDGPQKRAKREEEPEEVTGAAEGLEGTSQDAAVGGDDDLTEDVGDDYLEDIGNFF